MTNPDTHLTSPDTHLTDPDHTTHKGDRAFGQTGVEHMLGSSLANGRWANTDFQRLALTFAEELERTKQRESGNSSVGEAFPGNKKLQVITSAALAADSITASKSLQRAPRRFRKPRKGFLNMQKGLSNFPNPGKNDEK